MCARPSEERTYVSSKRMGEKSRRLDRSAPAHKRGTPRRKRVWVMLMIALGAAAGANLRYALSVWVANQWGVAFPYGTLLINVSGSFAIGVVMVLLTTRFASSESWRLVLVTGLLGGFTTFSTFSYETYMLLVSGSWLAAGLNMLASVGLGMVGVFLGAVLARLIV
jgi:fluoride exporter